MAKLPAIWPALCYAGVAIKRPQQKVFTKGETAMKKATTRRGFVRNVAVGAGSIVLVNSLRETMMPSQSELVAAPAAKTKYDKYILVPEIKQYQDLQVFEIRGKDMRGFDWALQMAPVEAINLMTESGAVNADRAKAYIGAPDNVKDIGAEIEVSMGTEPEVYKLDSASVTYIPKGTPHQQRVLKKPTKASFALTLTLPPKYVAPPKPKK
jgi:hypothetical protein